MAPSVKNNTNDLVRLVNMLFAGTFVSLCYHFVSLSCFVFCNLSRFLQQLSLHCYQRNVGKRWHFVRENFHQMTGSYLWNGFLKSGTLKLQSVALIWEVMYICQELPGLCLKWQ